MDALVLDPLNALLLGQTQSGFNVRFDYIGQALPGALPFDINDSNFNVLFSDVSTDTYVTTNQVPEPGAGWLVLIALGCIAGAKFARKSDDPPATTAFASETA